MPHITVDAKILILWLYFEKELSFSLFYYNICVVLIYLIVLLLMLFIYYLWQYSILISLLNWIQCEGIKGLKFVCVGEGVRTLTIMLHTKVVPKLICNISYITKNFKNLIKIVFSIFVKRVLVLQCIRKTSFIRIV